MSSYYYDTVMLDNPMVFYPMDESNQGNGQVINDVSKAPASALNGTYNGTQPVTDSLPLVSGGVKGTVLGSSNYLTIPALEAWSKSRETYQFSFECWFLLNGDNQGGIRLLQPTTTSGVVPENYIGIEDGQIIYKISNATNLRAFPENTVAMHSLMEPATSHYLVATFDNGTIQLYIDGKLVQTVKSTYSIDWNFSGNGFKVSGPSAGNITVDAIAMYRYVIPESSIQRHYLLGRSTIGSQEIARRTQGHFFPIDDLDSKSTLDIDWPSGSEYKWPYWDKSHNVEISGSDLGLLDITSPDSVDDNMMFTGGAFQCIPGSKLLADDQSTFNRGLNLFENSSFDVDVNGNSIPDGWTPVITATGTQTITPDAMSSQNAVLLTLSSGTNGQKVGLKHDNRIRVQEIVINDGGNPYGILPVTLPTPEPAGSGNPLAKMSIAVDVRGTLTAQKFQARVFQWNSGGTALADTVIPLTVSNSWVRRMASFDILSGAVEVQVQFEIVSDGTVTGQVFIDNAQLELGLMYNPYVDGWFRHTQGGNGTQPRLARSDIYDSGAYALKLECNDTTATHMGVSTERLPADPDDVIYARFSTYWPSSVGGAVAQIWFQWFDSSGNQLGGWEQSPSFSPTQGTWQAWRHAAKAPANTSAVKAYLIVYKSATLDAGEEIYFDNIYVNELTEEAAQYLVVEEMNRIGSANNGAAGVGFYLDNFHSTITNKEFAIMSFDEEDKGMAVVKKYDTADSKHKIVLRHSYKENGVPTQYDQTIKELVGGDYAAWHYVLLAWEGDSFSVALDDGTWIIDDYVTSDRYPIQLSYDTELTLGAGLDGNDGLGTAVKNVKVYAERPEVNDFTANQTANGNYYLPLATDINICMKGYSEFVYDLTPLYDAVDDAKIEWGPVNNQTKLYGRTSQNINLLTANQASCSDTLGTTAGWENGGYTTVSSYTGWSAQGKRSILSTYNNIGAGGGANISYMGNVVNKTFTISGIVKRVTGSRNVYLAFGALSSGGGWIGPIQPASATFTLNSSTGTLVQHALTVPQQVSGQDVYGISVYFEATSGSIGDSIAIDCAGIWEGTDTEWSMPPEQLTDGGEPLPIKGGYCPSLTTTKYYVRAEHETTNAIYKPANLSYLSMTFLDDVKFKTKSAGHQLRPTGSYTVSSKSTPVINQFRRNGIDFKRPAPSKNLVINGGFTYDTNGWLPYTDGWCKLERSTEEYVSGGSSLKVTTNKDYFEIRTNQGNSRNFLRRLPSDRGLSGFGLSLNAAITTVGLPKSPTSTSPVVRIERGSGGGDSSFGTSLSNGNRIAVAPNSNIIVSCKVWREVNKPLQLFIQTFNSSNALVQSTSTTYAADGTVGQWITMYKYISLGASEQTVSIWFNTTAANGWSTGDVFNATEFQIEQWAGGTLPTDYVCEPLLNGWTGVYPTSVQASTQYTLSAKVKLGSGQCSSFQIYLDWYAPDTWSNYTNTSAVSLNDTWQTVSVTGTSPANAVTATLRIVGNTSKDTIIYIDEVQLEAGGSVTSYEDNIPSVMSLELDRTYMKPTLSEDGWPQMSSMQQHIGSIETWYKANETLTTNLSLVRGDDLTGAGDLGAITKTANQSYQGDLWTKVDTVGSSYGIRCLTNLSDLTNGAYYIGSIEVYNPGVSNITMNLDWCDTGGAGFILKPKERRVVSTPPTSRGTYDSTFRFFDITLSSSGTFYARRPKIELSSATGALTPRRITIMENAVDIGAVSGVYYDVDGITYKNMNNVYVDGAAISRNGLSKFTQGKWHHIVANPVSNYYYYNAIKNPGIINVGNWSTDYAATTGFSSVAMPTPNNRYALALEWKSATAPVARQYSVYTHMDYIYTGRTYTISFYARSTVTPRTPFALVDWRDAANTYRNTLSVVDFNHSTSVDGWTYYTAQVTAPADTAQAYIMFAFTSATQNEVNYIAGPMFSDYPYPIPYFDGASSGAWWISTANASGSNLHARWTDRSLALDNNMSSRWFFNGAYNGVDTGNASYSNVTIHEAPLTATQALANYKDTLSRGDTLFKSDNLGSGAITDGTPLLISAPWQHHSGSP